MREAHYKLDANHLRLSALRTHIGTHSEDGSRQSDHLEFLATPLVFSSNTDTHKGPDPLAEVGLLGLSQPWNPENSGNLNRCGEGSQHTDSPPQTNNHTHLGGIMGKIIIRVDRRDNVNDISLGDFINAVNGTTWFFVLEQEETNPHYHGYLDCTKNINAVRNELKRRFPTLQGNKDYSMKTCKVHLLDDYITYMCKGESAEAFPDITHVSVPTLIDEAEVGVRHHEYWRVREEIDAAKERREIPLAKLVYDECHAKDLMATQPKEIWGVLYDILVERNKAIPPSTASAIVMMTQMRLDNTTDSFDKFFEELHVL